MLGEFTTKSPVTGTRWTARGCAQDHMAGLHVLFLLLLGLRQPVGAEHDENDARTGGPMRWLRATVSFVLQTDRPAYFSPTYR